MAGTKESVAVRPEEVSASNVAIVEADGIPESASPPTGLSMYCIFSDGRDFRLECASGRGPVAPESGRSRY